MQASEKPRREWERAKEAVERMRKAKSFEEFEESWREFLRRIDRVWNKAGAHFKRSPKWTGWAKKFIAMRTKDELLSYLMQARNADEHTVGEIAAKEPGEIAINAADTSRAMYIRKLEIQNGRMYLDADNAVVILVPDRAKLLPVTNRGKTYAAPVKHLGSDIDPNNILDVAERGLRFYEKFLSDAEAHFIK
jgi:hypothetical protein